MARSKNPLSLEYVLLGFVELEPIHGYDLYKKVSEPDGIALIWRIKQSHLYALLDKLEMDGMLSSKTVAGDVFPSRKEFQVTVLGKKNFHAWLTSPVQHGRDMRQEFLAKLYFAQSAQGSVHRDLIQAQIKICSDWLSNLKNNLNNQTDKQPFAQEILKYRISQTQAMIDWLNISLPETKEKA